MNVWFKLDDRGYDSLGQSLATYKKKRGTLMIGRLQDDRSVTFNYVGTKFVFWNLGRDEILAYDTKNF